MEREQRVIVVQWFIHSLSLDKVIAEFSRLELPILSIPHIVTVPVLVRTPQGETSILDEDLIFAGPRSILRQLLYRDTNHQWLITQIAGSTRESSPQTLLQVGDGSLDSEGTVTVFACQFTNVSIHQVYIYSVDEELIVLKLTIVWVCISEHHPVVGFKYDVFAPTSCHTSRAILYLHKFSTQKVPPIL